MKRINYIYTFFLVLLLSAPFRVDAQTSSDKKPLVIASFSKDTILIGDQIILRVTVDKDIVQETQFPVLDKGIGGVIEILSASNIDTIKKDGRRISLKRDYLVTCFDAGNYVTQGFPILYVDKNVVDTIFSQDSMRLFVNTFEIDTTKQTIADIKLPIEAPLQFKEIQNYIFIGLIILIILAVIIYYIRKYRKNKSIFSKEKPILPAHIEAMNELEKLFMLKMWRDGHHKEYYTALTDIIRVYIEKRYNISAMEMTSEEILNIFKKEKISDRGLNYLKELLSLSDFVKFAKLIPLEEDNETSFSNAYNFVQQTKPIEVVVAKDEPQTTTQEKKTKMES